DDGTQDIILDYAARYPHIVPLFQKARSRGSPNVRALFDMARSEYVAICDGDDYFTDPDKLQTQADLLDANPDCGLCFHIVRVTYEDDPERERLYPPVAELPRGVRPFYYLGDLIRVNLIQTNSVMYRWRFKDGLPDWFRSDLMPGDWYWHLLHAEKGKIGFINRVMSVYRRHKAGVYYLAEVDRLKHRYTVGARELEMYDAVNRHFGGKFESILLDLTNGVFADCLKYQIAEKAEADDNDIMEELAKKYPHFAQHFLNSLKVSTGRG
ncbi:MAG: glycosyltransferase, partial [Desulfovibrio sp.]|nr:glycosyltransferase [Desulfovibrio sp.]